MKKRSNTQYARAFYEAYKSFPEKARGDLANKFAAILVRDHKLKQAKAIIKELALYVREQSGEKQIEITLARETEEKVVEKIKKAFGNKVEAKIIIDSAIIGGVKIKTRDQIWDGSLKTQILKLKEKLV